MIVNYIYNLDNYRLTTNILNDKKFCYIRRITFHTPYYVRNISKFFGYPY